MMKSNMGQANVEEKQHSRMEDGNLRKRRETKRLIPIVNLFHHK